MVTMFNLLFYTYIIIEVIAIPVGDALLNLQY